MNNLYSERMKCIFCNSDKYELLLPSGYNAPLSFLLTEEQNNGQMMPYNIMCCTYCNNCQIKYIADLNIVYNGTHIDNFGTVKKQKFEYLFQFITENDDILGVIEIGACHNYLADKIIKKINVPYTIIEPNNISYSDKINYIKDYIENIDICKINANTLIMSDVFEHFYNPIELLEKIKNSKIQYIYLNHPDFDFAINHDLFVCLNTEHTFQIEHQYLFALFENYHFRLKCLKNIDKCSVLFGFERVETKIYNKIYNLNTKRNVTNYLKTVLTIVEKMNNIITMNSDKNFYIWPASVHSIILFMFGLNYHLFTGILDNSPNKIGKFLYAYNLKCYSFQEIYNTENNNICIFISGAGNYINEIKFDKTKIQIYKIQDLTDNFS